MAKKTVAKKTARKATAKKTARKTARKVAQNRRPARPTLATRKTCHNGHAMKGDNVFTYKGGTWCNACRSNSRKRARAKRILGDANASQVDKRNARAVLRQEFSGKRWKNSALPQITDEGVKERAAKKRRTKAEIDRAFKTVAKKTARKVATKKTARKVATKKTARRTSGKRAA